MGARVPGETDELVGGKIGGGHAVLMVGSGGAAAPQRAFDPPPNSIGRGVNVYWTIGSNGCIDQGTSLL
jgi:hypothetical protein